MTTSADILSQRGQCDGRRRARQNSLAAGSIAALAIVLLATIPILSGPIHGWVSYVFWSSLFAGHAFGIASTWRRLAIKPELAESSWRLALTALIFSIGSLTLLYTLKHDGGPKAYTASGVLAIFLGYLLAGHFAILVTALCGWLDYGTATRSRYLVILFVSAVSMARLIIAMEVTVDQHRSLNWLWYSLQTAGLVLVVVALMGAIAWFRATSTPKPPKAPQATRNTSATNIA